jgi:hypothetical protein
MLPRLHPLVALSVRRCSKFLRSQIKKMIGGPSALELQPAAQASTSFSPGPRTQLYSLLTAPDAHWGDVLKISIHLQNAADPLPDYTFTDGGDRFIGHGPWGGLLLPAGLAIPAPPGYRDTGDW